MALVSQKNTARTIGGRLCTTFPYDLALAETGAWQMPKAKIGSQSTQLYYPVDDRANAKRMGCDLSAFQ